MYLIKGITIRTEKRKITTGFWKWKKTRMVKQDHGVYELSIKGKTIDEAMSKLAKLDTRRYALKINEIVEV